jgi:hypothetical protein
VRLNAHYDPELLKLPFIAVVYDIKCVIDETLDAVENLSDAIINALGPVLQELLPFAVSTTCKTGIKMAGLCV